MKKLFALIFAALLVLILCSCGAGPAPAEDTTEADPADLLDAEEAKQAEMIVAAEEEPPEPAPDVAAMSYATLTEDWREDPEVVAAWSECHDYLEAFAWEPVDSSAIRETAYSWLWQAAAVRFHSNPAAIYVYRDVPEEVYRQLVAADSVGGYYNQYIKGYYECERFD